MAQSGDASRRGMKRFASDSEMAMTKESAELGQQLMEWAKKMGYTPPPGKPFPDVTMFQRMCKGNLIPAWRQVIKVVKPADEVAHIRKTLLKMNQQEPSKASTSSSVSPSLPIHLKEKKQLQLKIEAQEKKKGELSDKVQMMEELVTNKKKMLIRTVSDLKEKEREKEECVRKISLLKLKKREVLKNVALIKEFTAAADKVCPPTQDSGLPPHVSVQNCIEALQKSSASKGTISETDRKRTLWNAVEQNIDGLTAESLWHAISHIMTQQISDMSTAASSVLLDHSSKLWEPLLRKCSLSSDQFSLLNGMYLETFLEGVILKGKIKLKYKECNQFMENFVAQVNSTNSKLDPEEVKKWVHLSFKKAELLNTLLNLKHEVSAAADKLPNLSDISAELKELKSVISQLEDEITSEKRHIEGGLGSLKLAPDALKFTLKEISERQKKFKDLHKKLTDQQIGKEMGTRSDHGSLNITKATGARLSSTLVGDITACSNFALNTSFQSTISSLSDQQGPFMLHISTLKEAVSKEARKFFKLPLTTVPVVKVNGTYVSECRLMVKAPLFISHSLLSSGGSSVQSLCNLVCEAPVSSAASILIRQLNSLNHHRALSLCQLLSQHKSVSPVLCAMLNLESLQVYALRESSVKSRVEDVEALLEDSLGHLVTCKEALNMWCSRPVQQAVPSFLLVKGKSLADWRKLCDS